MYARNKAKLQKTPGVVFSRTSSEGPINVDALTLFFHAASNRPPSAGRSYIDEMCLAADIVNVEVFLRALKKPGKRGSGALWRTGI